MPASRRHRWLPQEDMVVDRQARALAAGRYPSMLAASRACSRLLASPASVRLSFESVRTRMRRRVKTLGLSLPSAKLTNGEARVVNRHIKALFEGRYRDAREAAEACQSELSRLPGSQAGPRVRTLVSVQRRIYERCRKAGRIGSHAYWRPDDDAVVRRFSRALVRGRYPSIAAAARACRSELIRRHGRSLPGSPYSYRRSPAALRARVHEKAPELMPWSRSELGVVDRYVRALFEGRYRFARAAAEACTRELARACGRGRSADAVHDVLSRRASNLGLPRYKSVMGARELKLIEHYARRLDQGEYRSWAEAARACNSDLRRLYAVDVRRRRLRLRGVSGHSLVTVLARMHELARQLGLRGPHCRRWDDAEIKLLTSWLRWYERHKAGRPGRGDRELGGPG